MEVKDAIKILAAEIAETRFPIKNGTRDEFDQLVKQSRENYGRYYVFTEEVEVDGNMVDVEFHMVGHNASHEFALGLLSDGRFVKRACGEDWDEDEELTISVDYYVENVPGYLGHW